MKRHEQQAVAIDNLYKDVREIIAGARQKAIRAVNAAMVFAYWQVGKRIVEEDQAGKVRADYGVGLVKYLAEKLTADFGKSFDERELRKIRQFYFLFPIRDSVRPELETKKIPQIRGALRPEFAEFENIIPFRSELSWTHYRLPIRVENVNARHYYMHEAADNQWSNGILEHQVNSLYMEKIICFKSLAKH